MSMFKERKPLDYNNRNQIYNDCLPESSEDKSSLEKIEMPIAKQSEIIHHARKKEQRQNNTPILEQNDGIHQIKDNQIKRNKNKREPIAKQSQSQSLQRTNLNASEICPAIDRKIIQ